MLLLPILTLTPLCEERPSFHDCLLDLDAAIWVYHDPLVVCLVLYSYIPYFLTTVPTSDFSSGLCIFRTIDSFKSILYLNF